MKTNLLIPTLLGIIIQGVVGAQTPESQVTIKHTNQVKILPVLGAQDSKNSIKSNNKNIETPSNLINELTTNRVTTQNFSTATLTIKSYKKLNEQANDFESYASDVINIVLPKTSNPAKIKKEADKLQQQAFAYAIKASEVLWQKNTRTFLENNQEISYELLSLSSNTITVIEKVTQKCLEARKLMNQAVLMRQEAYACTNLAAALGNMQNAEEKEASAIRLQQRGLQLINDAKKSGLNLQSTDLFVSNQ
jgi:bifunctional DNase/RNase